LPRHWPHSGPEDLAERPVRYIEIGGPQHFWYCSNFVRTSKYSSMDFLPQFLMFEFDFRQKPANVYFMVIAILQMIPQISETYGVPTTLIPLFFIFLMDATLILVEDNRRHDSDDEANSTSIAIYDAELEKFQEHKWSEVSVGDFIQISSRAKVPADCLLISVSEKADVPTGKCFVETKSLDGETNLKPKQALGATYKDVSTVAALARLKGSLSMEHPNKVINSFNGVITLDTKGSFRVGVSNVILRGSVLRNCEWAIALVMNTGNDTKILMSAPESHVKISLLTSKVSVEIGRIFLFLTVLCILGSVGQLLWEMDTTVAGGWYLEFDLSDPAGNFFLNLVHFLLLHATFIPVSLYVSIMLVRYGQAYFMQRDLDMYDEDFDKSLGIKNFALNEDLGQISHILTDKTGTLTRNVMDFRRASINGIRYGAGLTSVSRAKFALEKIEIPSTMMREEYLAQKNASKHVAFHCPNYEREMGSRGTQRNHILNFFRALSLCHDAEVASVAEKTVSGKVVSATVDTLSAMNADDEALIHAADHFGFRFLGREDQKVRILNKVSDKVEEIDILQNFSFSSRSQRMGVVIREPNGRVVLLMKGAETAILPLLNVRDQADLVQATTVDRKMFASDGLRCLYLAQLEIPAPKFHDWAREYLAATQDVAQLERQKEGEPNLIDDLEKELLRGMELLGCTGVEDKLQHGVSDCVEELHAAGICLWMLTGDNEDTATNIALACRVLLPLQYCEHLVLTRKLVKDKASLKDTIFAAIHRFDYDLEKQGSSAMKPWFMIIDGSCLAVALADEDDEGCRELLSELAQRCRSIVACRVSPSQKSELVDFLRDNRYLSRVLAIGDGANDVGMIKAADVGVGVYGQEGTAAVGAADYAIAQFKFLAPLILRHGQFNYIRLSHVVLYTFYKNVLMSMAMAWFNFFSGFSGQAYFTDGAMQMYNLIYTSIPILVYGIYDTKFSHTSVLRFPQSYRTCLNNHYFNSLEFWKWIGHAVLESTIVVVLPMYLLTGFEEGSGMFSTFWSAGVVTLSCVVIQANTKMLFIQSRWNVPMLLLLLIGPISYFLSILTINYVMSFDWEFYHVFNRSITSSTFWLVMLLSLVVLVGKDTYSCAIDRHFNFKAHHIIEEKDAGVEQDRRKGKVTDMDEEKESGDSGDKLGELREANLKQMSSPKFGYSGLRSATPGSAESNGTLYTDGSHSYWTGSEYTESRPASSVPGTPMTPGTANGGGGWNIGSAQGSRRATAEGEAPAGFRGAGL
jgi:phospholipid-transporting ATPase